MRTLPTALQSSGRWYARLAYSGGEVGSDAIRSLTVTLTCSGSTERLTLGATPAATLTAALSGTGLGLQGRQLTLYLGKQSGGVLSELALGVFTVTKSSEGEDTTALTAYDAMAVAMERTYAPSSPAPSTALTVLEDVCAQAGVTLGDMSGVTDCAVSGELTGYTCREMAGCMAALLGKNAVIGADGTLALVWYKTADLTLTGDDYYSGGLSLADGDWTLGRLDCTVTTKTAVTDADGTAAGETENTVTLTAGDGSTGIAVDNPYMTQSQLDTVWSAIGGLTYRAGTISCAGVLAPEPGDVIAVTDTQGASHLFAVMQQTLSYDGGLKTELTACAETEESSAASSGPVSRQLKEITADIAEIKNLSVQNLTAQNAKLEKLEAEDASIRALAAEKASITDLEATNVKLGSLASELVTYLHISSSRGTVFKNASVETVLTVAVYYGSRRITDAETLRSVLGDNVALRWSFQRLNEDTWYDIDPSDSRISGEGFTFTIHADDVDAKATFLCELMEGEEL